MVQKWMFLLKRKSKITFPRFDKWKSESSIDFIRFIRGQDSGPSTNREKVILDLRFQRNLHFLAHLGGRICDACSENHPPFESFKEVEYILPL